MAKIERMRNATRNIAFGVILKIYQILVPFLMRTAMIFLMGVEYLGLNSLFTSVLQVLNLAELGVGSAMVYSMYRPISENDETTICALMKLYKIYYRIIGFVIAAIGLCFTPFVSKLISGDVPTGINIEILYLLNLGATVLSYWMFAYKGSILQAHQRTDVASKVTLLTSTIQYVLQLSVLWLFKDYYLYVIVLLMSQVLTNVITAFAADKLYPEYQPKGCISKPQIKQINRRIRDLFTSKLGSVIYDSADTIVVSSFLGLTVLAVYQNYYYLLNAITSILSVLFSACIAGIGNSIIVESEEKNLDDLNKFTFVICWVSGFCSVCLLCLYQPFMELWVGKDYLLSFSAVICFVVYFFVRQINSLFNMYKDATGMWHEDRFRPLTAALVNLVLNIVLVQLIGLYGVLLSTVIAILCVGMPWLLHNLFTVVFEKKFLLGYLKKLLYYCGVTLICCIETLFVCTQIECNLVVTLFARGLACLLIPNLTYYVACKNRYEFSECLRLGNKITKGRFELIFQKMGMKE